MDAPLVIYTDGSASRGTSMGGAAVVVTDGDPEHPNELHIIERKGSLYTCSYEEEVEAMKEAALWISEKCDPQTKVI